jgi:hypothetical protein
MEPFLRLLESPAARLTTDEVTKAARFCHRLLGPANKPPEQLRALHFISTLKLLQLQEELKGELQELSESDNAEIANAAKQLRG